MKSLKFALALVLTAGMSPCLYADDANDEAAEAVEVVEETKETEGDLAVANEQPNELKELIHTMKQDRCVSKDQVNRLKKLIKDKGWGKQADKARNAA